LIRVTFYVCCKGCIDPIKKGSAKYISKLEKEGLKLDKTPFADPKKQPNKHHE